MTEEYDWATTNPTVKKEVLSKMIGNATRVPNVNEDYIPSEVRIAFLAGALILIVEDLYR